MSESDKVSGFSWMKCQLRWRWDLKNIMKKFRKDNLLLRFTKITYLRIIRFAPLCYERSYRNCDHYYNPAREHSNRNVKNVPPAMSDQGPPCLLKNLRMLGYSKCAQWRSWSDCSLIRISAGRTFSKVRYLTLRLIWMITKNATTKDRAVYSRYRAG